MIVTMQETLTSREREIFNLLLDGVSPKEIAYKLHISSKAVDYHRGNLYGKLGVHSIQELFAKYLNDRLKVESANSAVVEPEEVPTASKPPKGKRLWLLILAGALVLTVLIFLSWLFFIKPKAPLAEKSSPSSTAEAAVAENSFIITLDDNSPWGWARTFYPVEFENIRVTAGDSYTFTYAFTSDVDLPKLSVFIADRTVESENFFRMLCLHTVVKHMVLADIEYSGSVTLHVLRTASSEDPFANLFGIETNPYEGSQQPTLTFTRFEIAKANKRDATTPTPSLVAGDNLYSLTIDFLSQDGWFNRIYLPSFRNTRITEGDIYTVSCSFTSDVDFDWLQVLLYDNSDPVYSPLSPAVTVVKDVKANIEHSGTVTLIAYKSASSTIPSANVLHLDAITLTPNQPPTLTFTKLEVTKVN
jgi:DNA-binding CsgD family transcriptional regulator